MSTFLYYLPTPAAPALIADRTKLREEVRARGLADRFAGAVTGQLARDRVVTNHVRTGPDDGAGLLLIASPWDGAPPPVSTFHAGQQWYPGDEGGGTRVEGQTGPGPSTLDSGPSYWIGIDPEHRPTPAGLRRKRLVAGYDWELADGQTWHCPTARQFVLTSRLPMTYRREGGTVSGFVKEEYRRLWKESEAWCVRFLEDYRQHRIVDLLGFEGAFAAAALCLGVNYRVAQEELTLLNCIDDEALERIIDAAIDVPAVNALDAGGDPQKKTFWRSVLDDLQSLLRGGGEETPDTCPAGAITS